MCLWHLSVCCFLFLLMNAVEYLNKRTVVRIISVCLKHQTFVVYKNKKQLHPTLCLWKNGKFQAISVFISFLNSSLVSIFFFKQRKPSNKCIIHARMMRPSEKIIPQAEQFLPSFSSSVSSVRGCFESVCNAHARSWIIKCVICCCCCLW